MFKVTDEWITKHATVKGGYKAEQLKLIGVRWPPKKGWKRTASGKHITEEDRIKFESYSQTVLPVVSGDLEPAPCGCYVLPWEDCEHTDDAAQREMYEMLSMPNWMSHK